MFALDGFSFSDDQTLDIGSASSGAGAGKVTFNPLHLSFTQPGLDPQLFQMLAAGTLFKEVDVLGYNVSGDGSHLVVDYSFGLVAGKTMSIDQSGITQLDLEFGQQEIQHFTQNPDGSFPSTPDTSGGWDRVRNIQVGPDQFADPPLTLPTSGVSSDTGGISLHDYVRFTLFNNTTVTVDGNQLFALDGFSFSDDQTLDIGSASSGAGAGKVTFNPLHLSFTQPGLDPQLFQMLAAGTLFKEVDVLGYNVSGDGSHLVVDYSFGLVAGKTMSIDQSGITQLDLEYGSQAIQFGNQAPVAADDPSIVLVGGTAAGNVLTNDSDPDGDSLTVSAVAGLSGNVGAPLAGTYGHLTLDADGSFSYAADNAAAIAAGATGSHLHDIFSYTASDGLGGTDNASLDITLDRLPVAADDTSGALAGGTAAGNVLVNDSDPDGDSLTVSAVFAAGLPGNVATPLAGKFGDLTLNADGSFNYAADKAAAIAAGATGNHLHDIFSYTASDGLGGTDNAILDITLDRLPVTADDTSGALAGGTAAGNVLANDNDPDGDSLTVSAVFAAGLPGNVATPLAGKFGDLTLNADGSFTYAADNAAAIAAGPTGSHLHDIFSYTASDGLGGTANASLDIALDRLPVAINDLAGVQAGKTISGNVLANDHDPDGDPIQLLGISGGSLGQYVAGKYGWLVLASDGTYNYASNKSASLPSEGAAQDSFTYTERDGQGGVAQATLSVTVVPNGMNYIAGAPGATISSGNGKSVIDASLGGETVLAGNGKDTIVGGPNDMLTGGNGPDTFQFGPSSGPNTIRDFDVHNDVIAFDHTLFADFTDIKAHIQQLGADAVITYHGTDTLTLQHVNAGSLHASDFVLV